MKKLFLLAVTAMTLLPSALTAQDKFEAHVKTGIVSRYMWRGTDMAGASLQSEIGISWKGLSLSACGSTGFDKDDLQDLDANLNYTLAGFNIGVTDYWQKGVDSRNRYFYYSNDADCPHQLEANIGYSCKYGSLQAYTMVYGNDYKINGDRAYSTYIELSIPFRAGGLDWDVRAGVTPMETAGFAYQERITTDEGRTKTVTRGEYFYGDTFTCNLASVRATKNIQFKTFKMPVFVELHANPYLQRANLILGISVASL